MVPSAAENDMLLAMMNTIVGKNVDLEPAQIAFESTRGDFATRFTAAVEALFARLVRPEVFIDIPDHPEQLVKAELDALVRPASVGFLRSHPNKDDLLDQVKRIKRRQERRPAWIPRTDRDGNPLPAAIESADTDDGTALCPRVITSFPELGEVTIQLPAGDDDRPELTMTPGGIGELEAVLHTVLAAVGDKGPVDTVWIDAQANEALVPEGMRWWARGPAEPEPAESEPMPVASAAQDPGVASELLVTSETLGGLSVADNTPAAFEAVVTALASAGDWRYSRRWLLGSRRQHRCPGHHPSRYRRLGRRGRKRPCRLRVRRRLSWP